MVLAISFEFPSRPKGLKSFKAASKRGLVLLLFQLRRNRGHGKGRQAL
jgi:hypothetical protein